MEKIRNYLSFILTLLSIVGLFILAYTKGVDIISAIPIVLGIYVGGRTMQKGAEITAAGKDPDCDTLEALKAINGIQSKADPESK